MPLAAGASVSPFEVMVAEHMLFQGCDACTEGMLWNFRIWVVRVVSVFENPVGTLRADAL